ncbi:hypothetical protein [Rhodococcus artemisiae]|uniref:Cyclic di-GMP-binding protein n=1 Tax=Rhodococcus artemisiae TaxID=714159 RepID=A0ABU7L5F1_9NOCA|nr:hypothetical protein [Rhodococcus artemisiae]MEE2056769.1 hypothetical protein [Rhodococcus artemisiae]
MADDDTPPEKAEPKKAESGESDTPDYFPGEKERSVPTSAWWVLAVAVVLLLGFVIVRPLWFGGADDSTAPLSVPADRHFTKTLAGLGSEDGTWLTDSSPSTSFLVSLPVDSEREQTRLHLTGTTQVAEDSTVFMSVAMDGQQVYESEMPRGNIDLDVGIDIPQRTAQDGQVRVRVETRGILHTEVCTPEDSPGMVIHLDPGTVVEAALSEPIRTVRDAVSALGRDLTVVLTDESDEWRSTAADIGIAMMQSGYEITYSDRIPESGPGDTLLVGPAASLTDVTGWRSTDTEGQGIVLGTIDETPVLGVVEPLADLAALFLSTPVATTADTTATDPRALATVPAGDPAGLGALGADITETEITENHSWTARYSLADLPGGRLPEAVRVDLRMPASPADLTWILNVSLNGQLVESRRLDTPDPVVVPLPPTAQLLDNRLTLTIQRDRDLGGCDVRPTSYPIQLLDTSALVLGDDPGAGFTAIPRSFAAGYAVYAPGTETTTSVDLLNAMVPTLSEFSPAQQYPEYHWNASPAPGEPFVMIGQSPEVNTLAHVQDGRLTTGDDNAPLLDLTSSEDGTVIQCATGPGEGAGLAIQASGDPSQVQLAPFGRECVQVATPGGSVTVDAEGALVYTESPRSTAPR